jgi:hypothetical protein
MLNVKYKPIMNNKFKKDDLDLCHAGQDALYGEGTQFLPEIKKNGHGPLAHPHPRRRETIPPLHLIAEGCRSKDDAIAHVLQ